MKQTIHIAIVEDQLQEQKKLNNYIVNAAKEHGVSVSLHYFNDGLGITSDYQRQYDVIYLDVEMAIMDGMTTAKKIREVDPDVLIVFVTNHSQVAIQGYSVDAIDFLLKPLTAFVFEEHFKKILRKLPSDAEQEQFLYIKNKNKTYKIPQSEITYIESEGHSIHIHYGEQILTTTTTLKKLESSLDGHSFFRCNSGFIVNLAYVEQTQGNLITVAGDTIPVSRPRKKDFMKALTEYIGDTLL
ncbi:LytR/AlgR family response regulator transcription factor [Streptococcus sp. DD13]|uniref:LytR/AlgR family response regulator transcription factor n=1 Tax=Streptococcus sp. DD13 TaxID=1777881 RepID=UPI00079C9C04|nr:LytTR family DNA-binding domain-containing protein [Streptococcus sp. DD13]KXT79027.1 hypothetical protein STRDD13_00283 [Streptococcus sp. DD13]